MESENTQSLEKKVHFGKNLGHLGLLLGKLFIPYIGDKTFHKLVNIDRELIDKKELDVSKRFMTGVEVAFYISKYVLLGSLTYEIGKKFF